MARAAPRKLALDRRVEGLIRGIAAGKQGVAAVARHFQRIQQRALVRHLGMDLVVMKVHLPVRQCTDGLAVLAMFEIIMIFGNSRAYPLGKNFGGRVSGAVSPKYSVTRKRSCWVKLWLRNTRTA